MINASGLSRARQAGLVRGCCLGLLLLIAILVGSVMVAERALAAPNLGSPPGGTAHGSSEALIAATLAGAAATKLQTGDHAAVVLSERDLTVIAVARNPYPLRFRNPEARIRNGDIVVSADTDVGPFGVTAVATVTVFLTSATAGPQVTAAVIGFAVGQLGVPGFVADRIDPRGSATLNLTKLFAANPALSILAQSLDCVAVRADGLHVGFHQPGIAAVATTCA